MRQYACLLHKPGLSAESIDYIDCVGESLAAPVGFDTSVGNAKHVCGLYQLTLCRVVCGRSPVFQ